MPLEQTSISVQFDQVLTSLQKPVREDLQLFLKEFGDAPRQRYGGAEGFRESFRTSPAAYGVHRPGERGAARHASPATSPASSATSTPSSRRSIATRSQLQDFVTNFRIVTGSFAAEDEALEQAIAELRSRPRRGPPGAGQAQLGLPAAARVRARGAAGDEGREQGARRRQPWIGQLRQLVSKDELRGLVKDLRPTIPDLARARQGEPPVPRGVAPALLLLQRGRHPVGAT